MSSVFKWNKNSVVDRVHEMSMKGDRVREITLLRVSTDLFSISVTKSQFEITSRSQRFHLMTQMLIKL